MTTTNVTQHDKEAQTRVGEASGRSISFRVAGYPKASQRVLPWYGMSLSPRFNAESLL